MVLTPVLKLRLARMLQHSTMEELKDALSTCHSDEVREMVEAEIEKRNNSG